MLAWVGYVDHDSEQNVRFVAAHGDTQFLDGLTVSWGDNEFGHGTTGEAIRTGTAQVITDLPRSKRCAAWLPRINERAVRAACSFPLIVSGTTIGALSIYSLEYGTFGDAEVELLSKLANNLSYGIGRIRDAQLLADNESHLREAERLAQMGHWEWDLQTKHFSFLADEIFDIVGITLAQWEGTYEAFLETVDPNDRAAVDAALGEVVAQGSTN